MLANSVESGAKNRNCYIISASITDGFAFSFQKRGIFLTFSLHLKKNRTFDPYLLEIILTFRERGCMLNRQLEQIEERYRV